LAELKALWPYTEPTEQSRLQIGLALNAKLKQRDSEVERELLAAAKERVQRAAELKEREELLAQMLPRSTLEERYAQLAAADRAVEDDNARYKGQIAEKEAKLLAYRREIAAQEAVMREREAQLLRDLARLKELNATMDRMQGEPLSLLPVPRQLAIHQGTTPASDLLPAAAPAAVAGAAAVELMVGSAAAKAFNAECVAAQARVTPEAKAELAVITLKMAKQGDETAIRDALAKGASPNASNERDEDETVLYFAAKAGHAGCVAALLAAGADVDVGGNDNWTPLMHAVNSCERQCADVCRLLLAAGANIRAADAGDGRTALDLAIDVVKAHVEEEDGDEEEGEEEEDTARAHEVLALLQSVKAPSGTQQQ
jgi:hypothetical protein